MNVCRYLAPLLLLSLVACASAEKSGDEAMLAGRYVEAADHYAQAVEEGGDDPHLLKRLEAARGLAADQLYEEGLEALEANELELAIASLRKSQGLKARKDASDALTRACQLRAIELNEEASALHDEERLTAATAKARQAAELDPESADARAHLVALESETGRLGQVLDRADAAGESGNWVKAREQFETVLSAWRDCERASEGSELADQHIAYGAALARARRSWKQRDWTSALAALREAEALFSSAELGGRIELAQARVDAAARTVEAEEHLARAALSGAIPLLEEALELHPKSARARRLLTDASALRTRLEDRLARADLAALDGRWATAIPLYEEVLASWSDNDLAEEGLATAREQVGGVPSERENTEAQAEQAERERRERERLERDRAEQERLEREREDEAARQEAREFAGRAVEEPAAADLAHVEDTTDPLSTSTQAPDAPSAGIGVTPAPTTASESSGTLRTVGIVVGVLVVVVLVVLLALRLQPVTATIREPEPLDDWKVTVKPMAGMRNAPKEPSPDTEQSTTDPGSQGSD